MVLGDMAGGASIGGHEKGSRIGFLAGSSLNMLIELLKDIAEQCWVEGWGQEHKDLLQWWIRQKRSGGGVSVKLRTSGT
jgi:hypothetical protein